MTFFDVYLEQIIRPKGLDEQKARNWFSGNHEFVIDCYARELVSPEVSSEFFSLLNLEEPISEFISKLTSDPDYDTKFKELLSAFCKKTLFGLSKYVQESESWECPIHLDNVYRFTWFHFVIGNEVDWGLRALIDPKIPQRQMALSVPPQHLCSNDTPVFTPEGKKLHGDLEVGDQVIGLDGESKRVLEVHPKDWADKIIKFSNREEIKCNGDHLWSVYLGTSKELKTLSTNELKVLLKNSKDKIYLPSYQAFDLEKSDLKISPYLLGLWLGDGQQGGGAIYGAEGKHNFDSPLIKSHKVNKVGKTTRTAKPHSLKGLLGSLLEEDIVQYDKSTASYSSDKKIPNKYLTGSLDQRLELLAGLLDSDGTVKNLCGSYKFTSTNENLVYGIKYLLSSLGTRFSYVVSWPDKSSCGKLPIHKIYFQAGSCKFDIPTQRLKHSYSKPFRQKRVTVSEIQDLEKPEEGNCISVEDSHYIVGDKGVVTHNSKTFLMSGMTPAMIMGNKPRIHGLLASYNEDMAKTIINRDFTPCIASKGYKELFRSLFSTNLTKNVKDQWREEGRKLPVDTTNEKGTVYNGLLFAGSVSQVTGKRGGFVLLDDPIKDYKQAVSDAEIDSLNSNIETSLDTRVTSRTFLAMTQCVTGDALVSMADGSEKRLDNICLGDWIVTHDPETQNPVNKRVIGFFPQGKDKVFTIKTKSGKKLKANARHPFLVERNNDE